MVEPSPTQFFDESDQAGVPSDDATLRIDHGIQVAGDPCQAVRAIIAAALRAVPAADDCRLCLLPQPETALLVEACVRGGAAAPLDPPHHDGTVLQQTLLHRRVVNLPDLAEASEPDASQLLEGPARSLLVAPLHTEAAALGLLALNACQPNAFSPDDGERLRGVASQAAVILRHWARLLQAEAECEAARAVMEGLCDGLVILDRAGRILRANQRLFELVHHESEIPLPCAPDDPTCPDALRTLLQPSGGTIIGPYEVPLSLPSGMSTTLRVSPSPLSHPSLGEVRVVRDVSAERQAAEAQALFISQVAHELRGPLQHIMGFTSLIRDLDDLPRDSYERFFGHIKDEADHLARLIDDLVELSRIELGRFTMRPEVTCLDALVADVVERVRPRSQLRGLTLTLQPPPEPLWARVDPLRLTQVISNLVENALKFVPPGGAIAVMVRPDGDHHVVVSIADTGPGIPPEAIDHLFQRFYQVRNDALRSTPGMGLGLYTCREIISAHGGAIWAESEYGAGSTFHFRLDRTTP